MEEFLENIGVNWTLGLIAGVKGPRQKLRFKGKWYQMPYDGYATFTDLAVIVNLVTVAVRFLAPGVPLAERCLAGFPVMSLSLASARYSYLRWKRGTLIEIVKGFEESFPGDPYPEHLQETIASGRRMVRIFPIVLLLCMVAPMSPWCAAPFLEGTRQMTVPAWFPFGLETDLGYIIIVFTQTCGATFCPMKNIAFDDLFACLAFRQLAQFKHLRHNLAKILKIPRLASDGSVSFVDDRGIELNRKEAERLIEKKLKQWIVHHQQTLRLMERFQNFYSPAFLIQFSLQTLLLCTNAFVVAIVPLNQVQIILCAIYVLGNTIELLVTCRMGDLITYESSILTRDTQGKGWIGCPKWLMILYRVVLTRCQVPIKLSAFNVFPLNADTFSSIILSSYSYFTMLVKMRKTDE